MVTKRKCIEALQNIGLTYGDIVMIHSSLRTIGGIEGVSYSDKEGYCETIFDIFDAVLDLKNKGTIVVPTFTLSYARHQQPFIYETSPADPSLGIFAEFVRNQKESLRSLHPLLSLCAFGYHKEIICSEVSKCCYGWNSPFHRLYENRAKILLLGVNFQKMSFIHHIEYMAGVSHYYNKAYFTPAYKDGKELPLPYSAGVRYYNNKVDPFFERMENYMIEKGSAPEGRFGEAKTMLTSIRDVYDQGFEMLQKNPCFFIKDPYYTTQ